MNQVIRVNPTKGLSRVLNLTSRSFRPYHRLGLSRTVAECNPANKPNIKLSNVSNFNLRCSGSGISSLLHNDRSFAGFTGKEEPPGFFDDAPITDVQKGRRKRSILWSIIIGSLVGVIGSSYLLYLKMINVEAKSPDAAELQEEQANVDDAVTVQEKIVKSPKVDDDKALHKSKAGFRERKIIEYENRIRSYSTPDKVFRYFATLQEINSGTIYMTPEDFVRSLTPDTMQPEGLGLDEFKKFDKKHKRARCKIYADLFGEDCVFNCLGEGGLISFSDYVFLLTVLGTSTRHIDIAFRMFDLNGDGEVSSEEFKRVKTIFLNMTSTGMRHRDRNTTGNVIVEEVHSGIMAFFFGTDGKGKLTVDKFVEFKRKLQRQVMRLEFESYKPVDGRITEVEFAEILLTYASLTEKQRKKKIKKVKKAFASDEKDGILFSDYLDFFSFLLNIRDVDMALSFHTVAGQAIDSATFKQVAQTVAGVNLRDHLVDVVFKLFDENDDGQLSNKEFVAVMKDKLFRGLNKPKDTGLTRFLSGIITCARQHIPDYWTDQSK